MFPFNAYTKDHLVVRSFLIRQLKLLLFPSKCHFREPNDLIKDFNLNGIIMPILKSKRLTVELAIMITISPPIGIHQISRMPHILIIIKIILILLHSIPKHDTKQHPRAHIKPIQLDKYLALGSAYIRERRPVHLFVACF